MCHSAVTHEVAGSSPVVPASLPDTDLVHISSRLVATVVPGPWRATNVIKLWVIPRSICSSGN